MLPRAAAIIVLGLIAYGSMLPAPFKTMDDRISIVDNPAIKSLANAPAIFRQGYFHDQYYYRPLVNLSFMGEFHLFGYQSFFYNLDNLILHILNALLVFILISRLTNNEVTGFWTGLLFVMHPVQWEAVCNIPGRAILMSAFFVLASFVLFLDFNRSGRRRFLPLILITFFGGLLSKESTGILPFVLTAYLFLDRKNPWTKKILSLWPFGAGIIGYFFLRHQVGVTKVFHAKNLSDLLTGFVTFLRSVITDLRLFVLPLDLHFDRCLPIFRSLSDPLAVMTILFWAAALILLYWGRTKISPFVFFLIGWFALELLPVSQLVAGIGVGAGHVSTAEHFLYLACVPVLTGVVLAFRSVYESNVAKGFFKPVLLKFIAAGFLAFLLLTSVEQSIYASNEYTMIERSLFFEPDNPRIQGAMGLLSVFRNDIPDAEKHFRAAIKADPWNPSYHISLGTNLCQQGRWIEGLSQLVALDPGKEKAMVEAQEKLTIAHINEQLSQGKTFDARGWLAIGIYYAKIGHNAQAIDAFGNSVRLNPKQTDAWFNLGSLFEGSHNWPAAKTAYRRLLDLPDTTAFQRDYASEHLTALEKF